MRQALHITLKPKRIWKLPSLLFHSGFYNAPALVTLILIIVLIAAAIYDVKTFTIPHFFSYAVIGLFVIKSLWVGINFAYFPWHLLSMAIAFALGFLLFVLKLMGGGDVKLFAALGIWVFPLGLLGLVFCIAITGLLISTGVAMYKMASSAHTNGETPTFADRYQSIRRIRIPYGPAIAIGTTLYLVFSNNIGL
ncbi:MAG: hypothetical protein EX271_01495 [Acidimicrobiales bacterium]|nr:hypothetical protein [Hyphomonadaceae bacterium]RZV44532.1 MAG: hypothetical protein EX271_01495 [Acidimicrobiales bacterium]